MLVGSHSFFCWCYSGFHRRRPQSQRRDEPTFWLAQTKSSSIIRHVGRVGWNMALNLNITNRWKRHGRGDINVQLTRPNDRGLKQTDIKPQLLYSAVQYSTVLQLASSNCSFMGYVLDSNTVTTPVNDLTLITTV